MERDKETLNDLLITQKKSYEEVGRIFKVTGAAIKKQALRLGIDLQSRKVFPENWVPHNKRKDRFCEVCNTVLLSRQSKTCSRSCDGVRRHNVTMKAIESNGEALAVNSAKKFLVENRGYCCSVCNLETWNNQPIPLVLDHIDGNASNNSLTNLRLVCGNCDMQLPTYKGRNKGNGRFNRRQRYQQGKSY